MSQPLRLAVVVASLGRPQEVGQLLARLERQTSPADLVALSVESAADLPAHVSGYVKVAMGPRSLTAQRNRGIELVKDDCDIIVFFDDDYLPSDRALAGVRALFAAKADVAAATGRLLSDGIKTGGIDYGAAIAALAAYDRSEQPRIEVERDLVGVYGCNMAFRTSLIEDARFDENLPLYGWQEDIDFAGQLRCRGRVVKTRAFVGVHRGVGSARSSGVRLGYSQIANPLYLMRKKTMPGWFATKLIMRNFLANHVRAIAPEPWIDRAGRLRGNWIAVGDVVRGRDHPKRILSL